MGYDVEKMAFYETSTNRMILVALPQEQDIRKLEAFVVRFREFCPGNSIIIILINAYIYNKI